jgi:hypothetical protein
MLWWHEYQASPLGPVYGIYGERGELALLARTLVFFMTFLDFKMRQKNQNTKPQKRYLEVSRSTMEETRALFRFTDKRRNQ